LVKNLISGKELIDVKEIEIKPISLEALAKIRSGLGCHIITHNGCYWEEIKRGFYQPVHLLARLTIEQAVSPPHFCWGYRAALSDEDSKNANGTIPVHLLNNLDDYDTHVLSSNRRYHLRKCKKNVTIIAITRQKILREQGYEVLSSSLRRTQHKKLPTRKSYLKSLETINFNNHLFLAGFVNGKLAGYISGYAVNKTAYIINLYVHTKALKTNIAIGLTFDFIQTCRRSGKISEIVHGLHAHKNISLCRYKESLGFQVKRIPSRVRINWPIGKLIQLWRPNTYYILTGGGDNFGLASHHY
jgi:hypothetical protein